jgi:hypothetical protein
MILEIVPCYQFINLIIFGDSQRPRCLRSTTRTHHSHKLRLTMQTTYNLELDSWKRFPWILNSFSSKKLSAPLQTPVETLRASGWRAANREKGTRSRGNLIILLFTVVQQQQGCIPCLFQSCHDLKTYFYHLLHVSECSRIYLFSLTRAYTDRD